MGISLVLDYILTYSEIVGELNMSIQPKDPSKRHFQISIAKSLIRFGAGGFLIAGDLVFAGTLLILAEVLGILEEL